MAKCRWGFRPFSAAAVGPTEPITVPVFTASPTLTVGTTAAAANGRQPHLHFSLYQDGNPVDPRERLPER